MPSLTTSTTTMQISNTIHHTTTKAPHHHKNHKSSTIHLPYFHYPRKINVNVGTMREGADDSPILPPRTMALLIIPPWLPVQTDPSDVFIYGECRV